MDQISCIIVEDEPLAAELLQDYISQLPILNLKQICIDALYAIEFLHKEKVELVFLDLHLPKLKGLDFINSIQHPPQIIITTAYHEYALKSYEYNVVDYLLKPIEFSRFVTAVNKVSLTHNTTINDQQPCREGMFFNVDKKQVKIYFDEILYIESVKEYIKIVTKNKSIITKYQIGLIEKLLPQFNFLRVHRSFIIAKNKIDSYTASEVELNGHIVPIGRLYKDTFSGRL
jgi:DNA-binding LytR/AlgR family response regulator